jgi:hypothetical protein
MNISLIPAVANLIYYAMATLIVVAGVVGAVVMYASMFKKVVY